MKKDLHILMLEDSEFDADLNKAQLQLLEEYNCIITCVANKESYLNALDSPLPDIVISDFNLPQYNGLQALNDLKAKNLFIPFIFVTGTLNEETAADTIKAGAWDYVVKDRLFRLPLAIKSVLKLKEEKINTLKAMEQNKMLSMALEQSPVHIVITNPAGITEYVNTRFTEVTGYSPDEVIGHFHSLGNDCDHQKIVEYLKKGNIWRTETKNIRKNNTEYWEYVSIAPLKNEEDEITHLIYIKEDVTQRKKMEQTLIQALEKAEQSDKLKEAFLQNLSHEIRTPLNAIVGFSNLLKEDNLPYATQCEYTDIINQSSNQLLSIVSDILTISRIQTGLETLTINALVVNDFMENLKRIFALHAEAKNLEFKVKKGSDDPTLAIYTDEIKLSQIISNLLQNAIKFTHQGKVEFGYEIAHDFITFFVKDTGIGIAKENHAPIFERFRQADTTISTNYGGTGLGLSISRSFAEMMGGKIYLESELGKGSIFYLSLPYQKVKFDKKPIPESVVVLKGNSQAILVAEDEEYNYLLIEALLEMKDFRVIHAWNGKEALALYQEHPEIVLILMDIKMPVMDGQTAMNEIRKMNPGIPIIAQTAYSFEQEKQNILESGFDEYIPKPIKKEELWEKIQKFIPLKGAKN